MPSLPVSDARRRYLIAIGASTFDAAEEGFGPLDDAEAEVERIERLMRSCGAKSACTEVRLDRKATEIKDAVCRFFESQDLKPADVVALYFTGHGEASGDVHYLCPAGSHPNTLARTAFEAADLAKWIGASGQKARHDRVGNILLIIDACYAGEQVAGLLAALSGPLSRSVPDGEGGVAIVCAARAAQTATPGALAEALETALARLLVQDAFTPIGQPYVRLTDLIEEANRQLDQKGHEQRAEFTIVRSSGAQPFLRNPKHRPEVIGANLEETAWNLEELKTHFEPRARGVEIAAQAGTFFTGRTRALREVSAFLGGKKDSRTPLLVTGDPGSGKSALLGRIVCAASPLAKGARRPASRSTTAPIDVPIHAHHALQSRVVERIGIAIGLRTNDVTELIERLRRRRKPLRVVVDALDEAIEPTKIASEVLNPLAAIPGVRVVVGARRSLQNAIAGNRTIDLDASDYFDRGDLAGYVEARLLGTPASPYRGKTTLAKRVATTVAKRADKSFLVGAVLARSLAESADPVDIGRDWAASLPVTVGEAFDRDLERFGADTDLVRDVLRPLAFAIGRGLPQESLWAQVASRLSGRAIDNDAIERVKQLAGFYITHDVEDAIGVYRLYHEAFAEHLRASDPSIAVAMYEAMHATVPQEGSARDWSRARPYVLRHLAHHALVAGRLAELVGDLGFVLEARPQDLLAALWQSVEARRTPNGEVALLAGDRLTGASSIEERAAMLQLIARRQQYKDVASDPVLQRGSWRCLWTTAAWVTPHMIVAKHAWEIRAVALAIVDGVRVVVHDEDSTICVRDLGDGSERLRLDGHRYEINGIDCGRIDGAPVAVSAGGDGTVRLWDLRDGRQLRKIVGHRGDVRGLAFGACDASPVIASIGDDGTIRLWDARTGKCRWLARAPTGSAGTAVAFGTSDDATIVVSGHHDGSICIWEASSGLLRFSSRGHIGAVNALAVGAIEGAPVIASGGNDATVVLCDARSGEIVSQVSLGGHTVASSVAFCATARGPAVVSGDGRGSVRFWAGRDGSWFRELAGHRGGVYGIAACDPEGQPCLVTCSHDGTARSWDLSAHSPPSRRESLALGGVRGIAFGKIAGATAIAIGALGAVTLCSADDGSLLFVPEQHERGVSRVAIGMLDGARVIVTGHDTGEVLLRFERAGHGTLQAHDGPVRCLAFGEMNEAPVILSAGVDGQLRLSDPRTGRSRHALAGTKHVPRNARTAIVSATFALVGARTVVLYARGDGTLHVWNPEALRRTREQRFPVAGFVTDVAGLEVAGVPLAVTGCRDGSICLYDLARRHQRWRVETPDSVTRVVIGEIDGSAVVISGDEVGTLRVWDARTGFIRREIRLELGVIEELAFDSANRLIAVVADGALTMLRLVTLDAAPEAPVIRTSRRTDSEASRPGASPPSSSPPRTRRRASASTSRRTAPRP